MSSRTYAIFPELDVIGKPPIPDALVERPVCACGNFQGSGRTDAVVFAQPDHDRDGGCEGEALTEPSGGARGVSNAEVATLVRHKHPTMPEPTENTVTVDGVFEGRIIPRVGAAYQPRPIWIPFCTHALESREPSRRSFGMECFLGKTLLPSIPVAFVNKLRTVITIEFDDIFLSWEDSSPILSECSDAVDDKGWRYLDRLDLPTCQVEEFCSNSTEGM